MFPDRRGDVATQLDRRYDGAVAVPVKEVDGLDSDRSGCGALLGLADTWDQLARCVVEATRVATGDQQVRDLDAGVDPACDRTGSAEVDIVRVGEDAEDAFDIGQRRRRGRKVHASELMSP